MCEQPQRRNILEDKPITYWVLKHRKSDTYYCEYTMGKYGKIQTTCTDLHIARRFDTRKQAEKLAFGCYENYVPKSVCHIPKNYHLGNNTNFVVMDDIVTPKKKQTQTKKDLEILKLNQELLELRFKEATLLKDKLDMLKSLEKEFRILFKDDFGTLHTIVEALADMERRLLNK